jgi:hypothetical protein
MVEVRVPIRGREYGNWMQTNREEHKTQMEKGLGTVLKERSSLKQVLTEENTNMLKERVKAAAQDSSATSDQLSTRTQTVGTGNCSMQAGSLSSMV